MSGQVYSNNIREELLKQAVEASREEMLFIGNAWNVEFKNMLVAMDGDLYPLCGGEAIENANPNAFRAVSEREVSEAYQSSYGDELKKAKVGINHTGLTIDAYDDGFRVNGATFKPLIKREDVRRLMGLADQCSDLSIKENGEMSFKFDGDEYRMKPVCTTPANENLYECNFPQITAYDLSKDMSLAAKKSNSNEHGMGM